MTDRPRRASRLREAMFATLLVLGSTTFAFASLEVVLRVVGPERGDWYAAGPGRPAFLREHVRRNAEGFRDDPFVVPKPPDKFRVLAVGDSFTFGDSIPDVESTWPEVLEARLAPVCPGVEVLNLGVPGTNTSYHRALLDQRGHAYSPDLVILGFVPNDPEPPGANIDVVPVRLDPPLVPSRRLDQTLARSSHAYAWVRAKKNLLLERFGWKETYEDYVRSLYRPGPDWDRFVSDARSLAEGCRTRGIPLVVAIFPLFHDLERDPFRAELDRAAGVFRGLGADVVDLRETYRGIPSSALWIAPTDAHPNERAHRLAAEALLARVLPSIETRCVRDPRIDVN